MPRPAPLHGTLTGATPARPRRSSPTARRTGRTPLADHSYKDDAQRAYTITVTATVTSGPCTSTGGTLTFTLLSYVALGDSYSAGDGDGSYLSGTGYRGNECLRSGLAYPELVAKRLGNPDPDQQDSAKPTFDFHACTGAEIPDFSGSQLTASKDRVPPQLDFLRGGTDEVGLVTFTIGGNDAGFGPVMQYCATRTAKDPSCKAHSEKAVNAELATIEGRLIKLYGQIKNAPRLDKDATVIVTGYPRFFPLRQAAKCPTGDPFHSFEPADMAWINSVIKSLDEKIADAAGIAKITYVDDYDAFGGHELCQSHPYLFSGIIPQITSFHPTAEGQAALADLFEKNLLS
jgi:lysophospholipase L1-like esterase